jgi:hypothetical protein
MNKTKAGGLREAGVFTGYTIGAKWVVTQRSRSLNNSHLALRLEPSMSERLRPRGTQIRQIPILT